MVQPYRDELTRIGVKELRTASDVDQALKNHKGTTLVFVNSVCGCAAGGARPGLTIAMTHKIKPENVTTVFAGADMEATASARAYMKGQPASSPAIALFRDGQIAFMMHRFQIEGRSPQEIAADLTGAFDKFCTPVAK
jgi:putative YphP/YqiW family bacilliredoxin